MRKIYLLASLVFFTVTIGKAQTTPSDSSNSFTYRVVANKLSFPWEVLYGPDDSLWVTESRDYKITKIDPLTGAKRTILNLGSRKNFAHYVNGSNVHYARIGSTNHPWPQGGLEGMVLHPQFLTGKPYLYVIYVRSWDSTSSTANAGDFFTSRIERYTYNIANKTLGSPVTIIDTLPGSSDHNSGRLVIGPDMKLYVSIGDMGAGQFVNKYRQNRAQNLNAYQGKVLRFNLEPDEDPTDPTDPLNKWIPNDNSIINSINGKRSAIYSFGHRNIQGLVWGHFNEGDTLIANEHGPQTDDELNLISKNRNYGHPYVNGFCDGNMNGKSNGPYKPGTSGPTTEQNACITYNVRKPISTYKTTATSPATDPEGSNSSWPTVGPSSIDFYQRNKFSHNIPNWANSVLMTTLRSGRIIRIKLNSDGSDTATGPGNRIEYFRGADNRFRDLAINPNGYKIYVAVDSAVQTSGPTTGVPGTSMPNYPGSILEFTYFNTLLSSGTDPVVVQPERKEFIVYPNPVSDKLTVVGKRNVAKPITYLLYDITGNLVLTGKTTRDNFTIQMAHLAKGMYILKLFNGYDASLVVEKIVKQ